MTGNIRQVLLAIIVVSSLFFNTVQAAENHKKHVPVPLGPAPDSGPAITFDEFEKTVAQAKARGSRVTASVDINLEGALSPSFKTLRDQIIGAPKILDGKETEDRDPGITTPKGLHELLTKLNDQAYYEKLGPDAQYAAAQMAPLIVAHGIFNRGTELIEKSPLSHMAAVGVLRALSIGVWTYLPTDQWKAGMKYMIEPSDEMGAPIDNEDKLHVYIETELVAAIDKMRGRLEQLNFSQKPIYFDNQIFYGTAKFTNNQDRYVRIGEPERRAALAGAYFTLSSLKSLTSYDLNGLFRAVDELSKRTGLFSELVFRPQGTSDRLRFEILRDFNKSSDRLFHKRTGAQDWMNKAYNDLTHGIANSIYAYAELRARANDVRSYGGAANSYGVIFDPRSIMGAQNILRASSDNLTYMITGNGHNQIQSAVVNNEGRTIALQQFFQNSPEDLVSLMPNDPRDTSDPKKLPGFDTSPYDMTSFINGANRPWHNYLAGRPIHWQIGEYQKMFPEIKTDADIPFTARVLSQCWGGWILGLPMTSLVL